MQTIFETLSASIDVRVIMLAGAKETVTFMKKRGISLASKTFRIIKQQKGQQFQIK